MSRFHRETFRPPQPDRLPPTQAKVRKPRGKRSGHAPPPWSAQAEPVAGLQEVNTPVLRLERAARALLDAADRAGRRAARRDGRRGGRA